MCIYMYIYIYTYIYIYIYSARKRGVLCQPVQQITITQQHIQTHTTKTTNVLILDS